MALAPESPPARWKKGCDSCRIVVALVDEEWRLSAILFTKELDENGNPVLRIPGGKRWESETKQDCASRELREETGIYRTDRCNDLDRVFTYAGGHKTHVYVSIHKEKPELQIPEDKNVQELVWIDTRKLPGDPELFKGPDGVTIQPKHYGYLLEFFKRWPKVRKAHRKPEEFDEAS